MRIIVIGGGPAGMFSSGLLAQEGHTVTLIEKNEKLGKKLYITGKGRCNVTNDSDRENLINNIVSNPKFAIGALSKFSPRDTMSFIESMGCPLKVERGNRVFPVSDKSSDIIKCFEKFIKQSGVSVHLEETVLSIKKENDLFHVSTQKADYQSDIVVIATGGVSYPTTGSTGDGYKWAREFGHSIVDVRPGLIGLQVDGVEGLAGLTLKNVQVSAIVNGKEEEFEFGEMLFTHHGVSGPVILSLSSKINKYYVNKKFNRSISISIDLKPALDHDTLDARFIKDLGMKSNMDIKNILTDYMPKSLIPIYLKQAKIGENIKGNAITKAQREALINTIKNMKFNVKNMDNIEQAIITSGGVNVKDINPKDMQSKLVPGLYFIGEVLDIDALTGGFNIQLALSTAFALAKSLE